MSNSAKIFLENIFRKLREEEIEFIVLRNYEGLPDSVGYDVDLAMDKRDIRSFERLLLEVAEDHSWLMVNQQHRQGIHGYVLYLKYADATVHERLLKFDVVLHIWKGTTWLSWQSLSHGSIKYRDFHIPCPGVEAATLLLKDLLHNGSVKEEYRERIRELISADSEQFLSVVAKKLGEKHARILLSKIQSDDWNGILKLYHRLRRALVLKAVVRNPLSAFVGVFGFLYGHFAEFTKSPGLFLVLMGPDGVGKSSVSDALLTELHRVFQRHRTFHFRPGLLPELMAIKFRLLRKKGKTDDIGNPVRSTYKVGNPFVSSIRMAYYTLDFVLSYPLIRFLRGRRSFIIFDRYYYEYLVQQPSSGLPKRFPSLLMKIVPKPDLVVYLRGLPEVVLKRKQELTPEEFLFNSARYEALASELHNAHCVDVNADLHDVVDKVGNIIMQHIAQKSRAGN